jgi:hypothetical protein
MKSLAKACLVLLAALTLTAFTTNAQTNSPSTSTNAPAARPRPKPYTGTIASVDADAKTITVTPAKEGASQTLHIVAKTRIRKDGQPGTFADATVGAKVRGSAHKDDSGDWVANTVVIGELKKPAAAAAPAQQ